MSGKQRSRNFVFTHNNYPDTVLQDTLDCKFMCYGKEGKEDGKTPHLQGFVSFTDAKTLTAVIKKLKGCHVEVCIDFAAAITYCKKEGDYTERGVVPLTQEEKGQTEKERWRKILKCAQEGNTEWLQENEPQVFMLHGKAIDRVYKKAKLAPETLEGQLNHQWYYGPPGTGKSVAARSENPGAYIKDPTTLWWDDYADEDVVIIDDFDKYQLKMSGDMKRWLDRYPFQAQHKGGYQLIRPKKLVITSNYHPRGIWDDEITQQAILRRVTVKNFGDHAFNPNNKRTRDPEDNIIS